MRAVAALCTVTWADVPLFVCVDKRKKKNNNNHKAV